MINMFDALPLVVTCIGYLYLSKHWYWVCFGGAVLTYTATIVAFFCPESPRWHLVNGRTPDAIRALNQIAEINGSLERIPEEAIFVEDPTNFEVIVDSATDSKQHFASMLPPISN